MSKKIYLAMGLMSGTSADGIDAALVRITEKPFKIKLEAFSVISFPENLQQRILSASSPETSILEAGRLHALLGKIFSEALLKFLKKKKVSPWKIDFIGSHGQTVYHHPPSQISKEETPFTLQLGDGSVIAEKTGILTVSDFRAADMAAGGEGAPLVPYVDWRLFSHPKKGRVLLNLGGIANFTYLPPSAQQGDVVALDTGPGNALLDALMIFFTQGKKHYDEGGRLARKGRVNPEILRRLLSDPFFAQGLPKSAEKSRFGVPLAEALIQQYKSISMEDLLATAAALTAESVTRHLARYAPDVSEVFVSGGGAKNPTLTSFLAKTIQQTFKRKVSLFPFDVLGIPAKAKEAVAFAYLAYETLQGKPSNLPKVTGAKKACVLGKISPGWNKSWKLL